MHPRLEQVVRGVLDIAAENLPNRTTSPVPESAGLMLSVAAANRAANLLAGELDLVLAGRWSLTRILGRQVTEAWRWANALLLDPEVSTELLLSEDKMHAYRLNQGRSTFWDELEVGREKGIDLRDPEFAAERGQKPLLRDWPAPSAYCVRPPVLVAICRSSRTSWITDRSQFTTCTSALTFPRSTSTAKGGRALLPAA